MFIEDISSLLVKHVSLLVQEAPVFSSLKGMLREPRASSLELCSEKGQWPFARREPQAELLWNVDYVGEMIICLSSDGDKNLLDR